MTLWIVIVGFIIGFALAFSIGANDVANSFGTSVGSKVLTLRKACLLASIFEMAGAVLLGAKVSSTISKGIIDAELYTNDITLLELGYLASLIGASIWLLAATFFKLPVSGTHSIVGAVIGFTLVAKGASGVNWLVLVKIVASWFISPVFSGIISSALYFLLQFTILRLPTHKDQLERGILLLPLIYAATFAINSFSIFFEGPTILYFHYIPVWGAVLASLAVGAISALIARFIIGPWLMRSIISRRPTLQDVYKEATLAEQAEKQVKGNSKDINDVTTTTALLPPQPEEPPQPHDPEESDVIGPRPKFTIRQESTPADFGNAVARPKFILRQESAASEFLGLTAKEQAAAFHQLAEGPSINSLYLVNPFPMTGASIEPTTVHNHPEQGEHYANKKKDIEYPGIFQLFAFLQILTACFGAFAHGGNDVSNAIGPVIGLFGLHQGKSPTSSSEPELWILAIGGVGITAGLWILGRRVIETVGTDLSEVTPPSGFCIELGTATTVLIASHASVPVSTTHCKIGSVVFVGISRGGRREIDWRIFRNIILAWVITVPASGLISALVMFLFKVFLYVPGENVFDSLLLNASNTTTTQMPWDALNATTTLIFDETIL